MAANPNTSNNPPIWQTRQSDLNALGPFQEGDPVNFTFVATDADSQPVTFSILAGSLPPGLSLNSAGVLSGTIGDLQEDTEFVFVIRASDGVDVADRTFIMDVAFTNAAPSITTTATTLLTSGTNPKEGEFFYYDLEATDPEGDTLTWTVESGSLPPNVTLNSVTGELSGFITNTAADNSPYVFDIGVSDGINIDIKTFQINVISFSGNISPVWITSPGSLGTFDEGRSLNLVMEAVDPEGSTLTFSQGTNPTVSLPDVAGLPPGITLSPTGILSGVVPVGTVPNTLPSQTWFFTVDVTDNPTSGPPQTSSREFSLTFNQVGTNNPPVWITPAGFLGTVSEFEPVIFDLDAEDPDGEVVSYELIGGRLPRGIQLDPARGTLQGTIPCQTESSTFSFAVRASDGLFEVDRVFSFDVDNRFQEDIWEVAVDLTGDDKLDVIDYAVSNIDPNDLFRRTDDNFGIVKHPELHITTGLRLFPEDFQPSGFTIDVETTWDNDTTIVYSEGEEFAATGSGPYTLAHSNIDISIVLYRNFEGDGSTTDFSLTHTGLTEDDITIFIDGSEVPTSDWFITGSTLSFLNPPENKKNILVIFSFNNTLQYPDTDYNVLGDQLNFTNPVTQPENGDTIQITYLNQPIEFDKSGQNSAADVFALLLGPHHRKHRVIFGELKSAVARDDNGDVLYEVIYRDIIDPQEKAGYIVPYPQANAAKLVLTTDGGTDYNIGQQVDKDEIAIYVDGVQVDFEDYIVTGTTLSLNAAPDSGKELQVFFVTDTSPLPTLSEDIEYLTPASINNMRRELIHEIGLAAPELLPRWMRSEQTAGDPNTVLGFKAAIPLAYVKPGQSTKVLNDLATDPFVGCEFIIDRYHVIGDPCTLVEDRTEFDKFDNATTWNSDTTTYDTDTTTFDVFTLTTFDGDTTRFDVTDIGKVDKYIKFPPGDVLGVR